MNVIFKISNFNKKNLDINLKKKAFFIKIKNNVNVLYSNYFEKNIFNNYVNLFFKKIKIDNNENFERFKFFDIV